MIHKHLINFYFCFVCLFLLFHFFSAEAEMKNFLKFPDSGRILTKLTLRQQLSQEWMNFNTEEIEGSWKFLNEKQVVFALSKVLERLAGAQKKPQQPASKL